MNYNNPILIADSYKYSHANQYPAGTTLIQSYGEARKSHVAGVSEVVNFGIQSFVKYLATNPITVADVEEAKAYMEAHGEPFNYEGWMRIATVHNGFLPMKIRQVPEGTPVPVSNALYTVENTDPELPWITSFIETELLMNSWYGCTVATISRECKKIIYRYLQETAESPDDEINFKLHDFGYRGSSSRETAGNGGAAHLVNFMGTDTVAALIHVSKHYNATLPGFSIPAAEHSTMTLRGPENEQASYQQMIDLYAKPGSIFAVVSDSYDLYSAVRNIWIKAGLIDQVKQIGSTVVIRPDSGDPTIVPVDIIEILCNEYGHTVNSKGYKVLPPEVRVIQGDGITIETIPVILENMKQRGLSASNIAFGMGGGLLQKVDRDTFGFAQKACFAVIDGKAVDVRKNPATDSSKRSKFGHLTLVRKGNEYKTVDMRSLTHEGKTEDGFSDVMETVYHSGFGKLTTKMYTFDEVRKNAAL